MKILAVGDIHTKNFVIDRVKAIMHKYDRVIFVGDYADDFGADGLESLETWNQLRILQEENPDKVKLVLGNHDYIYVNRTPTKQTGYNAITQLAVESPAYRHIKDWLLSLPVIIEEDGVTFSHAGLAEGYDGGQDVRDLWWDGSPLWVRPGKYTRYLETPQVFGHTPSETCWEVHKNIWCIDTFSTYSDGTPIGDQTFLEITDGKKFKKIKSENSNNPPRKSPRVS